MSDLTQISLAKLIPWDGNVRKTSASDGIEELAASIAAHGLLQSLVVRPAGGSKGRGKFAVVAGQRRLLAMRSLAKDGRIEPGFPVPCRIVGKDTDAGELSLAENVVRVAMHPADQFEAFRDLAERGTGIADIAARFGVSEITVTRRLKLGRLSPAVLAAYRSGDIGLEQAQAFAVSDDHAAQERVLEGYGGSGPRSIRQALTEGEIPLSDKRARFVTVEAYEAAGGAVRRDLFDDSGSGTILDSALLDRLAAEKLEAVRMSVIAEGWQWAKAMLEAGHETFSGFRRLYPQQVTVPDEIEAEWKALAEEYDGLADSDEADDGDEGTLSRLAQIQSRIDEIETLLNRWPSETLAVAGAIVSLGHDGSVRIERGLVRPDDMPKPEESGAADGGGSPKPVHSAKLLADLTAQKTAAIAAELSQRPDIALAAVVHALALDGLYFFGGRSGLQVSLKLTRYEGVVADQAACKGIDACNRALAYWHHQVPEEPSNLWQWCLAQSRDTLLALLAFLAGLSVDAILRNGELKRTHADDLAAALDLDMTEWFTPGASNYFSRISSAAIISSICEARGVEPAPGWSKFKKAELAALAERETAGTGWLPKPVRIIAEAEGGEDEPVLVDADDDRDALEAAE